MKKMLIGALVGGIILFFWQFLSWSLTGIHQADMGYTPNQDAILQTLTANLTEEGTYFLPNVSPETPQDQHQEIMNGFVGKPWATVSYHKAMSNTMGMNMLRGLIIDIVSVWLLCWLLLKMAKLDFQTALYTSLAVGFIGYFTINYLNNIWFESNTLGYLIDTVVSWSLIGSWLGWWLPRQ